MKPCAAEVVFHNMSQQMDGKDKRRGCCRSLKHMDISSPTWSAVNLQSLQSVCTHDSKGERSSVHVF